MKQLCRARLPWHCKLGCTTPVQQLVTVRASQADPPKPWSLETLRRPWSRRQRGLGCAKPAQQLVAICTRQARPPNC